LSLEKGSVVAGITHFAAAALPKSPMCALKLGDRTSITAVIHRLCPEIMRARSVSAAAPTVWFRGAQGVFPGKAFFFEPEKGSIVARITRFAAAALPKTPICALKLGDRTSITAAIQGLFAGLTPHDVPPQQWEKSGGALGA
jgi:hypothetical protein